MPQILPGDTAASSTDPGYSKPARKLRKDLETGEYAKIAAAEAEGLGTTPTSLVYAGALSATDDRESARWAVLIARQLDLPRPPTATGPRGGLGAKPRKQPKQIIDPYTGKAIALPRAQALMSLGANLANVLDQPVARGARPAPGAVYQYVAAQDLLTDIPAESAVAFAFDMERKGTPLERFRANLGIINNWNQDTGTISDEEAVTYARWWAENKDHPITPGDLVTITTPELTAEIAERRVNYENYRSWSGQELNNQPRVTPGELDQLITARNKAITNPNYLNDARRILEEVDVPTWGERALSWSAAQLTKEWHVTQHIFVDVSTPFVGLVDQAQALVPGGQTLGDAWRETQRERQYIIQRINAGDSVGTIYAEDSFLPAWSAPAFDFAVGWVFDPFILGGKALTAARATRALPGLVEGERLTARVGRAVGEKVFPRATAWMDEIRYANFGGSVTKFSRSKTSRELFESLPGGDAAMFRIMDRQAAHFETASALEYRYMQIARAELLAKYPNLGEKAWQEWQTLMVHQFPIEAPAGSLAERVVNIRKGQSEDAIAQATRTRVVATSEGLVVSQPRTTEIIQEATGPLMIRSEVPHRLLPVPGLGGVKLGRLRFRESRLGQSDVGSSLSSVFNVNPGAVLRPGQNPEVFFARKMTRWRTFTEPEIREIQSRATDILSSGVGTERNMARLLEEVDNTAIRRIANRMGLDEEAAKATAQEVTQNVRRVNQQAVFGVTEETTLGRTIATRPLTESQLVDEIVSLDPVMVRQFMNRYTGTFNDLSKAMKGHGLPDIAAAAFRSEEVTRDVLRATARTWKFMVVPRPAYIARVILGDENLRFLATTSALFDRFASFELKKGVRGLIGKGLSKVGDESLRLGEVTVKIPRSGSIGYEPLANQAFHTEEALDDILRSAGLRDRSLQALGHHGAIMYGDVQHLPMWERGLNFQLGNSQPGRVALESVRAGETVAGTAKRLRDWARADNYTVLRTRIGIMPDQTYEWADKLAGMVHGYTMGNPDIAYAAITRSVGADILSKVPRELRPTIHGPLVESLTAAAGSSNPLKRFVNFWYDAFVRNPENVLNRQPYYRVWKRTATKAQYKMLEQQGYGRLELVENVGGARLTQIIDPDDAVDLAHLATLDDRQFLAAMRERGMLINANLDIRGQVRLGATGRPIGREVLTPVEERTRFMFNAEAHGIPPTPDVPFPVQGATVEDLGNGVRRYTQHIPGGEMETRTYAFWSEPAGASPRLEAFMEVPFDRHGIDAESIMLRASSDAPRGATTSIADAITKDLGADVSVATLLKGNIPVSRKGALFMRRRIKAMVDQNVEVIEMAPKITKPITAEIASNIDRASREFALGQVKKIMFDFTENTRFGEMMSAFIPFFQPWAEAYQVWGHILLHRNPAMVGYVRQTWALAEKTGVVKRDENGQWVTPWTFWQRATSLLPWVGGDDLPEGLGMVAPLSSFNLFLSSSVEVGGFPIPVPGLSPWAAIPLKSFFKNTQNPQLISYLFSYGAETPLVSRWMENTARAIDSGIHDGPHWFNDSRDESVAMDMLRLYQYLGTDRDENGDLIPADELKARALVDARRVNGMLGVIGFVAPTAGRVTFPEGYEEKEDELDQMRDSLGFEEGTDAFLAKYPELTLMTIGKTVDTRQLDGETAPRLPSSEAVQELFHQPGFARFAKRFPAWTAALVLGQDQQWDESSLAVFSDQIHDNAIRYKNLNRFYSEGQAQGFWNAVDAMYAHINPIADDLEAQGLEDTNARVQELATAKAEMLYDIYLRYPQYATKWGIRPNPGLDGQAIWDGDEGTPPSELVLRQAQDITELKGFESFPAIQGLKAYLDLRESTVGEMEQAGIDDIGSTTAERYGGEQVADAEGQLEWQGGLTERWEQGKSAILEEFPEVEPFINAFFDDDLEGIPSASDRRKLAMRENDPAKYEQYLKADDRLEAYSDRALAAPSGDQRSAVYNRQADYIDTLYETNGKWKVNLWFNSKSASYRETYIEGLQAKPPVFYTQFDWEMMGIKLSPYAAKVWASYRGSRETIDARSAAEERGGPTFLSGEAYESIDAQMTNLAKHDPTLRKSLEATRSFGFGLFHSLPEGSPGISLVDQKGKAGYAWRYMADIVKQVNDAVIDREWHGPDTFDSDDDKQAYVSTRDSVFDAAQEFMKWSPVFKEQWMDFQRNQLRGDPLIEWIMPDTYFPIGVTGD